MALLLGFVREAFHLAARLYTAILFTYLVTSIGPAKNMLRTSDGNAAQLVITVRSHMAVRAALRR